MAPVTKLLQDAVLALQEAGFDGGVEGVVFELHALANDFAASICPKNLSRRHQCL